jgi:endonuclease/exonuclease/phosphatase family metal-dependent hydrolase
MLKVVSVNIEFDRNLDTVIPFLKKETWDVLLLNELLEEDISVFENAFGEKVFFKPTMRMPRPRGVVSLGSGVMARVPARHTVTQCAGRREEGTALIERFVSHVPDLKYLLFLSGVEKDGTTYRIGLTHFPWTKDGQPDEYQRETLSNFLTLTREYGEMALFGDFNIPRGNELYEKLAQEFTDNIPREYKTSLDENLHNVGKEKFVSEGMNTYVVDYCFTTPSYRASNARLEFGVSDHAAVIADIEKVL